MMPDINAVIAGDGLRLGATDLCLDHFGYDGNQERKHRRDIPLLRARLARDPDHVYSWNHLGHALAGLGDREGAVRAWEQGVAVVRTAGVRSPLDALPYGSLLVRAGSTDADFSVLDEALDLFPRDYLFAWLNGLRLTEAGRYVEALGQLGRLTAVDADTFCSEDGVAYDARIFGAIAHEAAALCHFRLGRYDESARGYETAAALDAKNPAHHVRAQLAAARAATASDR
jgi:hypothetical protein